MFARSMFIWITLSSTVLAAPTVVVVVDDSGSMVERMSSNRGVRRIDAAKQALNVVLSRLPADAEVGILALNSGWIVPLQKVDMQQAGTKIRRLGARGGTPLGEFMKIGTDALLKRRAEATYGDYRLLVVTDGEANDQDTLNAFLPDIMGRGITVDVIGVDMQSDHSLATKVHTYQRADDPAALESAIADALAESDDTDIAGAQSDFELLSEFPVEIAPVVLSTLTTANNNPIGVKSADVDYPSEAATSSGNAAYPSPRPPQSGGGGVAIFGTAFCMGSVIFLLAVFTMLMKAARRA